MDQSTIDSTAATSRQYGKASFLSVINLGAGIVLGLITAVSTAHIYGATILGQLAIVTLLISGFNMVSSVGEQTGFYNEMAKRGSGSREAAALLWVTTGFSQVVTLILTVPFLLLASFLLNHIYHHPDLTVALDLTLASYLVVGNLSFMLDAALIGLLAQRAQIIITVFSSALLLLLTVTMPFLFGRTLLTAVENGIIVSAMALLLRLKLISPLLPLRTTRAELRTAIRHLPKLLSFGLRWTPTQISNVLLEYADTAVLAALLSLSSLGAYSRAYLIYSRLTGLSAAISRTLFPTVVRLYALKDYEGIVRIARRTYRYLLAVLLPSVCGIAVLAPDIMAIFGPAFTVAGPALAVLCLGLLFNIVSMLASSLSGGSGAPGRMALCIGGGALLNLVLNLLLDPHWGLIGAALSNTLGMAFMAVCGIVVATRYLRISIVRIVDLAFTIRVTGAAGVMGGLLLLCHRLLPGIVHLSLGIPIGIISYLAGCAAFGVGDAAERAQLRRIGARIFPGRSGRRVRAHGDSRTIGRVLSSVPYTHIGVMFVLAVMAGYIAAHNPSWAIAASGMLILVFAVWALDQRTKSLPFTLFAIYVVLLPFPYLLPTLHYLGFTIQEILLYVAFIYMGVQWLYRSHRSAHRLRLNRSYFLPFLVCALLFSLIVTLSIFQFLAPDQRLGFARLNFHLALTGISRPTTYDITGPLAYAEYRWHYDALDPLAVIVLSLVMIRNYATAFLLTRCFVIGATINALYLLFLQFTHAPVNPVEIAVAGRLGSQLTPFSGYHPNSQALLFGYAIFAALALLALRRDRLLSCCVLVLCVPALWLTYSRGSIIGVAAGLLCFISTYLWFGNDQARKRVLTLVGIGGIVIIALTLSGFQVSFIDLGRYETLFQSSGLQSINELQSREQIWNLALTMLQTRPFTGYGMDTVVLVTGGVLPAHQTFLEIAADLGYPGLLLFVAMLASAAVSLVVIGRRADHNARILASLGLTFLMIFVVGGLSESYANHEFVAPPLWIFLTVPMALAFRMSKPSQPETERHGPHVEQGRYLLSTTRPAAFTRVAITRVE